MVAAYALAAALCSACAARERADARARRLWYAIALAMLVLGVIRELEVQGWLTGAARDLAIAQGWYDSRRLLQAETIVALGLCGALVLAWLDQKFRDLGVAVRLALLGLVYLAVYLVVRATSLHHVDILLNVKLAGLRLIWFLELGGIAIVLAGAAVRLRPMA